MMKNNKILLSGFLISALLGCGGSSDDDPSPEIPDAQTPSTPTEEPAAENEVSVAENKLGAWIWYIDEPGLVHNDHEAMANYLAEMGVKRVFIKISDINYNWDANKIRFENDQVYCGVWQDACEPANLQYYKDAGIEPWAWTYNDVHNIEQQASMLTAAAMVGYEGFVLDIEVEFDGNRTDLEALMSAYQASRDQAVNQGLIDEQFLLGVTTWGNPNDHDMAIDIIDAYADFHMPQTYVEKWGGSFLEDIATTIALGDCEYRTLGATKPIWHIVSHEDNILSKDDIDTFIQYAGPNASVWRIANTSLNTTLQQVDWQRTSFLSNDCSLNNMEVIGTQE